MKVPKTAAIIGFNVCSSAFIALSAYGIFSYMSWESAEPSSFLTSLLYGAGILGSIGGLCYFGMHWDRGRAEEAKTARAGSPARRKTRNG